MSRAGDVRGNSATESFLSPLKPERMARKTCRTRDTARADAFGGLKRFLNPARRGEPRACLSPVELERQAVLP